MSSSETQTFPSQMLPENLPNYGFEVHVLPYQPEAVPINQVLANIDEIRTAFVNRYQSGDGVRVLGANEQPNSEEQESRIIANLKVPEAAYLAGEEAGILLPNLNSISGRRTAYLTGPQAAENGVPSYFKKEATEALDQAIPKVALGLSDADYAFLDGSMLNKQKTVHQVFELQYGSSKLRLYNFGQTPVTEASLKKLTNAMREQNDRTGGAAMEAVSVMAIVPEHDTYWNPAADLKEGLTVNAQTSGLGAITLNERIFKEDYNGKRDLQYTQGAHNVPDDIENIVAHEIQHALANRGKDTAAHKAFGEAVGWKYQTDDKGKIVRHSKHEFKGDILNPTEYGATEPDEDLAETGAALHTGGEWAVALGKKRTEAMLGFWAAQHTGIQGPTYIRCHELDLHNLPNKLGEGISRPIAIRPEFPTELVKEQLVHA